MSQRFTLDRQSFERLIAAASLVQQWHTHAFRSAANAADALPLLTLVETQQAIQTGALDLEAAMYQITGLALKLAAADGTGVWLFTQNAFVFRAGAGNASNSENLRLAVLSRLAPLDPVSGAVSLDDAHHFSKAKSLLVAPIYQGRTITGALAVFSARENAFTERDETNTRLMAGLLAHALDKAAEAQLKQSMTLERAAMQKVIERLIPSLMKLAGPEGTRNGTSNSPDPLPSNVVPTADKAFQAAASTSLSLPQDVEQVLNKAGSVRRPERTFDREIDLAETNPRWAGSIGPSGMRYLPANPQSTLQKRPNPVTASVLAEQANPPVQRELAPLQSIAISSPTEIDFTVANSVSPQPRAPEVPILPPPAFSTVVAEPFDREIQGRSDFSLSRRTMFAIHWLKAIPVRRVNLRFGFDYKPTLRAIGAGFAAVMLALTAFLALRSGETAIATAGTDSATAEPQRPPAPLDQPAKPLNQRKVAVAATEATPASPKPAKPLARVPESSHIRITDSRAADALNGLSRYEIQAVKRRAEYGDDSAAFVLGMAYEMGHGVHRSCSQAAKWVSRAAQQGNAAAEYNLGLRYRAGDGVKSSSKEAEKWFRRAARHKYSEARMALAALKAPGSRSSAQP